MHELTYASCFAQMMHKTASRFPDNIENILATSSPAFQLFGQCRDRYLACYPAAKDHWLSSTSSVKKRLRKTSRPMLDSKWNQLLCSFHGDDEAISGLLSQRADAFTFKAIGSHPDFVLSNVNFKITLQRRLLLPITLLLSAKKGQFDECNYCIGCGKNVMDAFGRHALRCRGSMGARARTWHDPIRDMISTMALNAGVPAKTEVNLSKVSGAASVQERLLRMDNVLGKSIVTDVCTTVCDTSLSSTIPGHAVAMKEKFKFDYYAPYLTADITLIPVCVDEHGRFGLQADSLFQFLAR